MNLNDILRCLKPVKVIGNTSKSVSDIVYDSRKVQKDCVFVCLKGVSFDGHNYAQMAVENGACVVISEVEMSFFDAAVVVVKNTREALAFVSSAYFGNPGEKLKTIGITGTKGKTTVSCMIKSILEKSGQKVGLIGTLGVILGDKTIPLENTTPESYEVQKYLSNMVDRGCDVAIMETSSIGLKTHRVDSLFFDIGVFTNFSEDHVGGNEHASMQEYLECKSMLFSRCKTGIVNIDDDNILGILNNHTCVLKTFGFSENADFSASKVELVADDGRIGTSFRLLHNKNTSPVFVDIPGKFSVYNALAAIAVAKEQGVSCDAIKKGLECVKVKGRVEPVKISENYTLLIDYAHNALSMQSVLTTLREYNPKRLITLFGAGGNRPKIRRYEMGEVSGRLSDLSVITEDNSRDENVMDIIDDIMVGINKSHGKSVIIPNRKEAIKYCIQNAQDGDIILLAGKGHETYQEIKGVKYPFDERQIINDIVRDLKIS